MTAVVGLTESGGGYKLKNTETNTVIDQSKISVEDGQLRVVLSGVLDLVALTRDLRENSYFVANDPPDIDSQGWGEEQDMENYYPYWVYRDDDKWIFAFTPEGFQAKEGDNSSLILEDKTREKILNWTSYLAKWCK